MEKSKGNNADLSIDFESVLKIARLKLLDDEKEIILQQLLEIFGHFSEIHKLELDKTAGHGKEKNEEDVEEIELEFLGRDDNVEQHSNQDLIVEQFCNKKGRYLQAPKTIGE